MGLKVASEYVASGVGEAQDPETGARIRYAPEVFDQPDIARSKGVILGASPELSSEHRWEVETPWLMKHIKFEHNELVLDYGCGIGRLSKEIINPVLGVDISPMMRRHALDYVGRPTEFSVISPEMFKIMVESGLHVSGMVVVWVLEHVLDPAFAVRLLMHALRPNGVLWHLGMERAVPYWTEGREHYLGGNDHIPILPMIERFCTLEAEIPVDAWPQYPQHDAGILRKFRRTL